MKLEKIHTILGLLFFPLLGLGIYFYKNFVFDSVFLVIPMLIYIFVLTLVGVLTEEISSKNRRIIIWFDFFSFVIFIAFLVLKYYWEEVDIILVAFGMWLTANGIIGIMTNTILLNHGKPYVYKNNSLMYKGMNGILIIIGVLSTYFFVTVD
jgi:hypothetical protein